jgi:hypothetical protein
VELPSALAPKRFTFHGLLDGLFDHPVRFSLLQYGQKKTSSSPLELEDAIVHIEAGGKRHCSPIYLKRTL